MILWLKVSTNFAAVTASKIYHWLKRARIYLLIVGALHSATLMSQEQTRYSLPELLKLLEKNDRIVNEFDALDRMAKAKRSEVEVSRWLSTFEAKAFTGVVPDAELRDPNDVNSFVSYDFENDFSFSRMGGFFKAQVDLIQPIWTWGKISHFQDAADMGFTLADWEKKKRLGEARQIVKRAYYSLLYASESLTTLREVEKRLNEANEKVEKQLLKDADHVSETDRLKIKVFQTDVQNRLIDAERGQRLARSAIFEIFGFTGDWAVAEDRLIAESVEELQKDSVISAALRARPELQQLKTLIGIKEHQRQAQRGDLFPTIFVAGQINYGIAPGRQDINNPFLVDDFNKADVGAVLGLKMDLGLYRTLNKMDQMQAEIDRMKAQESHLMSKVKLDVERVYEEAMGARSAIGINEDGFRAARSWLTSTGLAFNLGTADTKEVLESFAAYFKARADLVKSIYSLNMSLSELSEMTGSEVVVSLR